MQHSISLYYGIIWFYPSVPKHPIYWTSVAWEESPNNLGFTKNQELDCISKWESILWRSLKYPLKVLASTSESLSGQENVADMLFVRDNVPDWILIDDRMADSIHLIVFLQVLRILGIVCSKTQQTWRSLYQSFMPLLLISFWRGRSLESLTRKQRHWASPCPIYIPGFCSFFCISFCTVNHYYKISGSLIYLDAWTLIWCCAEKVWTWEFVKVVSLWVMSSCLPGKTSSIEHLWWSVLLFPLIR